MNELKPRRRGIQRTFSTFRDRTEKEFGNAMAENVERAVSGVFTCIVNRIARPLRQVDVVATLQENGWHISDNPSLIDRLLSCHDLASVEQRGRLSGHSQFEGALFLESLNTKYFGLLDERTKVLSNDKLPGSILSVSDLGNAPNPDYAFGLKAVFPHQADYLLWWATKHSTVWKHFAEPNDLDEKSWAVFKPSFGVDRTRSFAKCALGKVDFSLGPSRSEERFYLAAFGVAEPGRQSEPCQGSYLAYHVM
ncbi:hypothetical protein R1W00_16390 [Rhodovulum sp. FJ3]|nr:hypothetical protein [Rhodovulum sp. FJ3]